MDVYCRVCGEPWDCRGLHHTSTALEWWQWAQVISGSGCPCCEEHAADKITVDQWVDRYDRWSGSVVRASEGQILAHQISQDKYDRHLHPRIPGFYYEYGAFKSSEFPKIEDESLVYAGAVTLRRDEPLLTRYFDEPPPLREVLTRLGLIDLLRCPNASIKAAWSSELDIDAPKCEYVILTIHAPGYTTDRGDKWTVDKVNYDTIDTWTAKAARKGLGLPSPYVDTDSNGFLIAVACVPLSGFPYELCVYDDMCSVVRSVLSGITDGTCLDDDELEERRLHREDELIDEFVEEMTKTEFGDFDSDVIKLLLPEIIPRGNYDVNIEDGAVYLPEREQNAAIFNVLRRFPPVGWTAHNSTLEPTAYILVLDCDPSVRLLAWENESCKGAERAIGLRDSEIGEVIPWQSLPDEVITAFLTHIKALD